ncbi:MAG: RNA polymerase sigma factor [Amnibacterium sp.]
MSVDAKREAPDSHALVFTTAYRRFSPAVLGYLRARGVEDPEAVTQDVFLALYPRLADLTGGIEGMRTLLFSIAHARAVDAHRARARSPQVVEYVPEEDLRTTGSAEDDALIGSGVLAHLAALSDEHREVLALRVVADLSLEATASVMQRSTGAVKQLQRRALLALRARVSAPEVFA